MARRGCVAKNKFGIKSRFRGPGRGKECIRCHESSRRACTCKVR